MIEVIPIGEQSAPHTCHHGGSMPGRCFAPACENYWGRASFGGVPFPATVPVSRPKVSEEKLKPLTVEFRFALHDRCQVCRRKIPDLRYRHGSKFCSAKCAHAGER